MKIELEYFKKLQEMLSPTYESWRFGGYNSIYGSRGSISLPLAPDAKCTQCKRMIGAADTFEYVKSTHKEQKHTYLSKYYCGECNKEFIRYWR